MGTPSSIAFSNEVINPMSNSVIGLSNLLPIYHYCQKPQKSTWLYNAIDIGVLGLINTKLNGVFWDAQVSFISAKKSKNPVSLYGVFYIGKTQAYVDPITLNNFHSNPKR
ncbi:hypothetical protein RND81_12G210200 [Saponaria officinalis]|uniref:Uncharacterized protein n=1 Tax=Saponaria officinalis TaxID=3572 RepID=A0AAW1HDF5_SAPOF